MTGLAGVILNMIFALHLSLTSKRNIDSITSRNNTVTCMAGFPCPKLFGLAFDRNY